MNTEQEQEYVLGTHDAELTRLGLQHRLWSAAAYELWERAGFRPGQTILDLGCGPGYATMDLAQLVGPTGKVIAADVSRRFLDHLEAQARAQDRPNIETRLCDLQQLDLPPASLDGAYNRWVLCFLKDPERVVARVAAALRPGGVFAVQDYFNYVALTLAPRGPALERVVRAVDDSWRRSGGDSDFVARLPGMMARHSLHVREIRPILRVARPGSLLWQWPTTFFMNFVPKLVAEGYLTPAEQAAFEQEWRERSNDPHSFFATPPVFEVIAVKN
ncbi:MAG: methyltransferase domain-containing protein [Phycisphaerae bacterium]